MIPKDMLHSLGHFKSWQIQGLRKIILDCVAVCMHSDGPISCSTEVARIVNETLEEHRRSMLLTDREFRYMPKLTPYRARTLLREAIAVGVIERRIDRNYRRGRGRAYYRLAGWRKP